MKPRQRQAIIAALDERLATQGSWCGETHLQKSVYFLQELLEVPTGFAFILYKYGPFSRGLRQELARMEADGFLQLKVQQAPYGPSLLTTPAARDQLEARWPKTLRRHERSLDFVAGRLGTLGVGELERLATALWVSREHPGDDEQARGARITELKPHVTGEQALRAVQRVDEFAADAAELNG